MQRRSVIPPRALALSALLLVSAMAGGTGSRSGRAAAASLPQITLSMYAPTPQLARTLDPAHFGDASDQDMVMLINAGLIRIGTNDQVEPDLASHWTISNDHRTYTFYLRPNARFANGDAVTADTVKFSLERTLAPATASELAYYDKLIVGYAAYNAGKAKHLDGVKVLDPHTVQIQIAQAAPYFLIAFTYPVNDVLDPAVVQGKPAGDNNNYLTNTCMGNQGAGPFTFACQNSSSSPTSFYPAGSTPRYTLVPNPNYYGAKAHVSIVLPALGNQQTAYNQYLAGQLDTVDVPAANVDQWRANPRGQFHTATTSANYWMSLNVKSPPFNDLNCRLAVAWGIDREALATVLHHTAMPLYTILPPGFPGYTGDAGGPHYNLQQAQSYFARCVDRTTPVVYKYNQSDTPAVPQALQAMMQAVGFKVTLKPLLPTDWDNAVVQPMAKTGTQAVENGWQQDYPDPQDYLTNIFACNAGWNINGWCDSSFDRLAQQADATFPVNSPARYALYNQAQRIALNQAPVVTEYVNLLVYLQKPWIHGLTRTSAYFDIVAQDLDWSKVTVSSH